MKSLLFIIDMQNDFCSPSGSLYVPGAEIDAARLMGFIRRNMTIIDHIILTQDNHQVIDISHPGFWVNKYGENPDPYTIIMADEVRAGEWNPVKFKKESVKYLEEINKSGEYKHTIWPEHCIWGSEGAAIYPGIMDTIKDWARHGRLFEIFSKGIYPLSEHFGAFRANIPVEDIPETQFNNSLLTKMQEYDRIWIAGEAKSHCVANTISQMFDYPDLFSKIFILQDCMSDVCGFEAHANPVFEKAERFGSKWAKSTDILIND